MLSAIFCLLCALTGAAPSRPQSLPGLEPREDGSADIPAFLQAVSSTQARYARLVRGKRNDRRDDTPVSDVKRSDNTIDHVDSAGTKVKRADPGPPLPPIHVPMDEYATTSQWRFPEGAYLIESKVRNQNRPFPTFFDTLEVDYMVPSHQCTPDAGCLGDTAYKYMEMGTMDTPNSSRPPKHHYNLRNQVQYNDSVSVGGITVDKMAILSVRYAIDWPQAARIATTVMGLGGDGDERVDWFQAVCRDNLLGNRPWEFSFFYGRASTGSLGRCQFTIGGSDPTLYRSLPVKIPTIAVDATQGWAVPDDFKYFNWEVDLQTYSKDKVAISPDNVRRSALFDTASRLITLTNPDANALWGLVPGAMAVYQRSHLSPAPGQPVPPEGLKPKNDAVRAFVFPCSARPVFDFHLGPGAGTPFAVNFLDLNLGRFRPAMLPGSSMGFVDEPGSTKFSDARRGRETLCLSSIVSVKESFEEEQAGLPRRAFLGLPFLKSWYMIMTRGKHISEDDTVSLAPTIMGGLPGREPDDFAYLGSPTADPINIELDWPDVDATSSSSLTDDLESISVARK